jgi:hypothetical protein
MIRSPWLGSNRAGRRDQRTRIPVLTGRDATHEVHHKLKNRVRLGFDDFFDPTSEISTAQRCGSPSEA